MLKFLTSTRSSIKAPSVREPLHLEAVRDHVAAQIRAEQPLDFDCRVNQLMFNTDKTTTEVRRIIRDGMDDPMAFTQEALSQYTTKVLPGHGRRVLEQLHDTGEAGEKLTGLVFNQFARSAPSSNTLRLRTIIDQKTQRRVVRGVVSTSYAEFDDLQIINELLNDSFTREMAVIKAERTGSVFRVRMINPGDVLAKRGDFSPMVDAWNSEIGQRSTGLESGVLRLVCTNGMVAVDKDASFSWRHIGSADRIRKGFRDAIEGVATSASGVLDAYDKALNVSVDDAVAWMAAQFETEFGQQRTARVVAAFNDETTTKGENLAAVVDAITLAAQDEDDLLMGRAMERRAIELLNVGLAEHRQHGLLRWDRHVDQRAGARA